MLTEYEPERTLPTCAQQATHMTAQQPRDLLLQRLRMSLLGRIRT